MLPLQYKMQRYKDWVERKYRLEQQLFEAAMYVLTTDPQWKTWTIAGILYIDAVPLLSNPKRGIDKKPN